jgi:hypothetical protein
VFWTSYCYVYCFLAVSNGRPTKLLVLVFQRIRKSFCTTFLMHVLNRIWPNNNVPSAYDLLNVNTDSKITWSGIQFILTNTNTTTLEFSNLFATQQQETQGMKKERIKWPHFTSLARFIRCLERSVSDVRYSVSQNHTSTHSFPLTTRGTN